jgi:hypothetical protein
MTGPADLPLVAFLAELSLSQAVRQAAEEAAQQLAAGVSTISPPPGAAPGPGSAGVVADPGPPPAPRRRSKAA